MQQAIDSVVQFAAKFALLLLSAHFAECQTAKPVERPNPGQISNVTCAADENQSYALYLPSTYSAAKRWPIVYFFDPGGRGRRPLDLYRDLAETYGFIFAGSNNSKNFSGNQSAAVNAIWQDTHLRLSLDDHRIYTSGFSGGARVAGAMALHGPGQIAGVIAHGAGYPNSNPTPADGLFYYFAVGNQDFNWPEVISVEHDREKRDQPYRVRVYPGTHQWAPASVMEDALQWFQLKAMQSGALSSDAGFIDRQFQKLRKEADDAEKSHDALTQFGACRSIVVDFSGLRDTAAAAAELAALKQSPALKAASKNEQDQIAEQLTIEREISPKLSAYQSAAAPDLNALRIEIVQAMSGLKDQAMHARHEERRLALRRAFDDMMVEGIENGQQELEARHFDKAESCIDLMREISDDPWPALLLAETHAAMGANKQAIRDLREAVRRGLKDPEVLESETRLQVLSADPEFQKLIAEMKGK